MLIRWGEIYENAEILSPIDRGTWQVIGDVCKIGPTSRVIELASGKGAFAAFLASRFGCSIDCYDANREFVDYSRKRAGKVGLSSKLKFDYADINDLVVKEHGYDLAVCLGALYMFREPGWKMLTSTVKPEGYIAVSDMFCKKCPPPSDVVDVFFEEDEGPGPITIDDTRRWYVDRGYSIVREEVCSWKAWLDYYDSTRETLSLLARKYQGDREREAEIGEAVREDELIRRYGETYLGYMTFIMQREQSKRV